MDFDVVVPQLISVVPLSTLFAPGAFYAGHVILTVTIACGFVTLGFITLWASLSAQLAINRVRMGLQSGTLRVVRSLNRTTESESSGRVVSVKPSTHQVDQRLEVAILKERSLSVSDILPSLVPPASIVPLSPMGQRQASWSSIVEAVTGDQTSSKPRLSGAAWLTASSFFTPSDDAATWRRPATSDDVVDLQTVTLFFLGGNRLLRLSVPLLQGASNFCYLVLAIHSAKLSIAALAHAVGLPEPPLAALVAGVWMAYVALVAPAHVSTAIVRTTQRAYLCGHVSLLLGSASAWLLWPPTVPGTAVEYSFAQQVRMLVAPFPVALLPGLAFTRQYGLVKGRFDQLRAFAATVCYIVVLGSVVTAGLQHHHSAGIAPFALNRLFEWRANAFVAALFAPAMLIPLWHLTNVARLWIHGCAGAITTVAPVFKEFATFSIGTGRTVPLVAATVAAIATSTALSTPSWLGNVALAITCMQHATAALVFALGVLPAAQRLRMPTRLFAFPTFEVTLAADETADRIATVRAPPPIKTTWTCGASSHCVESWIAGVAGTIWCGAATVLVLAVL